MVPRTKVFAGNLVGFAGFFHSVSYIKPIYIKGQWPKTGAPGRFLARNGWAEL